MGERLYLHPTGLLYGPEAAAAVAEGHAGALAGGRVAFSQVRILNRNSPGSVAGIKNYRALKTSEEGAFVRMLEALERPRRPIGGVPAGEVAVMGVVNVTPDSFSDGGRFADTDRAVMHGRSLVGAGANMLDIGGESTRPGSDPTSDEEELARIVPVIEALKGEGVPISADTRKAAVMRGAVEAGAAIINDISALQHDPAAMDAVAELDVPVVLMHSRGDPKTMQEDPRYDDVVLDVYDLLEERVAACEAGGIARDKIIVDPGIGFGKTFRHNHALLRALSMFHGLGATVMLGVSRKAFIGALSGEKEAGKRVSGSLAAGLVGVMQGVQVLRVHDVRETVQAVRTWCGVWRDA